MRRRGLQYTSTTSPTWNLSSTGGGLPPKSGRVASLYWKVQARPAAGSSIPHQQRAPHARAHGQNRRQNNQIDHRVATPFTRDPPQPRRPGQINYSADAPRSISFTSHERRPTIQW
jgi:hypothetical protein